MMNTGDDSVYRGYERLLGIPTRRARSGGTRALRTRGFFQQPTGPVKKATAVHACAMRLLRGHRLPATDALQLSPAPIALNLDRTAFAFDTLAGRPSATTRREGFNINRVLARALR
jgi:hypothetical protein